MCIETNGRKTFQFLFLFSSTPPHRNLGWYCCFYWMWLEFFCPFSLDGPHVTFVLCNSSLWYSFFSVFSFVFRVLHESFRLLRIAYSTVRERKSCVNNFILGWSLELHFTISSVSVLIIVVVITIIVIICSF